MHKSLCIIVLWYGYLPLFRAWEWILFYRMLLIFNYLTDGGINSRSINICFNIILYGWLFAGRTLHFEVEFYMATGYQWFRMCQEKQSSICQLQRWHGSGKLLDRDSHWLVIDYLLSCIDKHTSCKECSIDNIYH